MTYSYNWTINFCFKFKCMLVNASNEYTVNILYHNWKIAILHLSEKLKKQVYDISLGIR